MAETEAVNGREELPPSEQSLALEEEERREEEAKKKAREPPIVYKDIIDVSVQYPISVIISCVNIPFYIFFIKYKWDSSERSKR